MTELVIIDQVAQPVLDEHLVALARTYVDARRQYGQGLLDMARAVALARESAEHGTWGVWLEAVALDERTARRLMAIHDRASLSPKFAEAVRERWLSASTAALVAERDDDDEQLLVQVLALPAPPSARQVDALAKAATLPDMPAAPAPVEHDEHDLDDGRDDLRDLDQVRAARAVDDEVLDLDDERPEHELEVDELAERELVDAPAAPAGGSFRLAAPASRYDDLAFGAVAAQVDRLYDALQGETTAAIIGAIASLAELVAKPLEAAERRVVEPALDGLRWAEQQLLDRQARAA